LFKSKNFLSRFVETPDGKLTMTCNLENELIVVDNTTCEISTVQLGLFGTDQDGDNKEEIVYIESIDS
jgi:hypothetical protein